VLYDEATGVLARLQCGGAVPAGSAIEPAGDNPEILRYLSLPASRYQPNPADIPTLYIYRPNTDPAETDPADTDP
jgi:hypothetical protein